MDTRKRKNTISGKVYTKLLSEVTRLKKLVSVDELTGVLNRKGTDEQLDKFFLETTASDKPKKKRHPHRGDFSVIFMDIDDFKSVNDRYGHKVGDSTLSLVASLLKEKVRLSDPVGRYGGEEFVVILAGASEEDAYDKAESIRKHLENNLKIFKRDSKPLTGSFGVASVKISHPKNIKELIHFADMAMYEAKNKRGKNAVVRYSELKKKI